jgi:hypothetical protein
MPAPTMVITAAGVPSGTATSNGSISLTFTSSQSTADFADGDVTVSAGTIGSLSGSGTTYTATFTPTDTTTTTIYTISVGTGVFTDSSDAAANLAVTSFTWTYDSTATNVIYGTGVFARADWTGAGSPVSFTIAGFTSIAVGNYAFQNQTTNISDIVINNTVVSIGTNAFMGFNNTSSSPAVTPASGNQK